MNNISSKYFSFLLFSLLASASFNALAGAYYNQEKGVMIIDKLSTGKVIYKNVAIRVDGLEIIGAADRQLVKNAVCSEHIYERQFRAIRLGMSEKAVNAIMGCGRDPRQDELLNDNSLALWTFESSGAVLEGVQVYINKKTGKVAYGPDGKTFKMRIGKISD